MFHHAQLIRVADPFTYVYQPDDADTELVSITTERFGIDEARQLQQQATRLPVDATSKTLVVRTSQITVEAQNALLKLLEEPPATSRFLFIIPVGLLVLDTLLSRVQSVEAEGAAELMAWEAFLAASPKERLEQISEWQKAKDTVWLAQIQAGLRVWLTGDVPPTPALQLVSERLGTRGASNKLLLELLALDPEL